MVEAVNLPKPLQDPRPPIWIGLSEGRRLMPEVVAKHGDGVAMVLGSDLIIHFTSTSAPIGGDIESLVADMEIFAAEVMPNVVGSSGS